MQTPPAHVPFFSIYRENFEVVEERHGKISLFPHTEQLPLLLRALNLEFYGKLPDKIARVDHRGDGFHKIMLRNAVMMFCHGLNQHRADRLRLFGLPNADLVSKVSIVQHITEDRPRGLTHRFRFYAGKDFFPEIRLSGRRLAFADHVLQRFSARVPNYVGEDLAHFLAIFYGCALISCPCGPGRAFIALHDNSIIAFPYHEETSGEYFIMSCLTINEINRLGMELPPCTHNFHYAENYVPPKVRHWLPLHRVCKAYKIWTQKQQLQPLTDGKPLFKWDHKLCQWIRDGTVKEGYLPGSNVFFLDRVVGPHLFLIKAGQKEGLYDEVECYKTAGLEYDWEGATEYRDTIMAGPHAKPADCNRG